MNLVDLLILLLALSAAWDILSERQAFGAQIAQDRLFAASLASMLWIFAVRTVALPPLVAAMLNLPAIAVFAIAAWRTGRDIWTSWRDARRA